MGEQTMYSYVLPANQLGTDSGIRVRFSGAYINNNGVGAQNGHSATVRIKFGGVTVVTLNTGPLNIGQGVSSLIEFVMFNRGVTNFQLLNWFHGAASVGFQTANAFPGVDTTVPQTLEMTVLTPSNSFCVNRNGVFVEFLQ
jgi:hypothetical protein